MKLSDVMAIKIVGFVITIIMIAFVYFFFSLVVNYVTPHNCQWFTRAVGILISLRIVKRMRQAIHKEINKEI